MSLPFSLIYDMWDFFFTPETLSYAVLICREARSNSISRKSILN